MVWQLILKSSPSKKTRKPLRGNIARLKLEALESRQLLSVTSSVFTIDPASSVITLSGDVAGSTILPQAAGSLTSSFTGSVVAQWDLDGQTIQFLQPGTALNAAITGNWQPQPGGASGNAPANYGGKVSIVIFTANIALRNLVVSGFTASPLALSGTGPYSFASTQTLTVTSGTADYNAGILGSGTTDISGLSSGNQSAVAGTFEDLGNGSYRVTEPISLTIHQTVGSLQVTLHIEGQVVATAVLPVVNLTDGTSSSFNFATMAVGGGGPVAVEDPAATVTRTPTANLNSMTVTLLNHPDDVAEFLGYDLGNSGLTTSGYDPASGQLVITGSADPSVYQAVLQTLTYENDSLTPDTSDRLIQFVVSDGTNTSVVRTTTVSVSAPGSPAPPPGLVATKPPRSTDTVAVSGALDSAVRFAHPEPVLNSLPLDLQTAAEELTITLFTIPSARTSRLAGTAASLSGGEVGVSWEPWLPVEALASRPGVSLT